MPKRKIHITFDFETLGVSTNAPPIQLAAAAFELNSNDIWFPYISAFNEHITFKSLQEYSYTPEYSTVQWWCSSDSISNDARRKVFKDRNNAKDLNTVIGNFTQWFYTLEQEYEIVGIWCHASFDDPILRNIVHRLNVNMPYKYSLVRDLRTLIALKGKSTIDKSKYIAHDALEDCKYQAETIKELLCE